MASPVVVSRIQNRRGTQLEFDGHVYNPAGPFSMYPKGYNGDVGYGNFPDFDASKYPNVLLPGEIGLCVDTRRMYIGNTDGRYVEIADVTTGATQLRPVTWVLQPTTSVGSPANFQIISDGAGGNLEYEPMPFVNIEYSITDSVSDDWNSVGTTFSRNGELTVTAISSTTVLPTPPINLPPASNVVVSDSGTTINSSSVTDISFIAQYNAGNIEILYSHNFPGPLKFNTHSIIWIPF